MSKHWKFLVCSFYLIVISCGEPETTVTNYIYRDGSVKRMIEMRSMENKFDPFDFQVPFDSTWSVSDSMELTSNDTLWVKRAQKIFRSMDEINTLYDRDSGYNGKFSRSVSLERRFRWFNTEFLFSENIGRIMEFGYPLNEFLNEEELTYFYSPQSRMDQLTAGPDSLKYETLADSIDKKTEEWMIRSIISEWIGHLAGLTRGKGTEHLIKDLRSNEKHIYDKITENYGDNFDSLWKEGIVQRDLLGEENAKNFRVEADSSLNTAVNEFMSGFKSYSVRMVMPGRLTGTNGFVDSLNVLLWPVNSEFFITQPYKMWAESKVPNIWAWIVSGVFLFFVLTGITLKTIKKG